MKECSGGATRVSQVSRNNIDGRRRCQICNDIRFTPTILSHLKWRSKIVRVRYGQFYDGCNLVVSTHVD